MSKGIAIPLDDGLKVAEQYAAEHFAEGTRWMLCGSARRKEATIRDLDFVVLDAEKKGTQGKDTAEMFCPDCGKPLNIKIQIWYCDEASWVPMIYFATGSGQYNIISRTCAKKKGLKLTRYALTVRATGEVIPVANEWDLQQKVGRTPRPPEERS
jgi:DNA polymerase/3'-5' exonuclease PolX